MNVILACRHHMALGQLATYVNYAYLNNSMLIIQVKASKLATCS